MMRAALFNQTSYFQNMMKPVLEVQQVVKKFENLNPLKNKQQTVVKGRRRAQKQTWQEIIK